MSEDLQQTAGAQEPATNQSQLQLGDVVSLLEAIQIAASRGAYRPEEFTAVGGVYERVFAFLESTGAVSRPNTEGQKETK